MCFKNYEAIESFHFNNSFLQLNKFSFTLPLSRDKVFSNECQSGTFTKIFKEIT